MLGHEAERGGTVTAAADCTPVYIMRDEKCVNLISVGRNYCLVKRCRSLQC